jgi:hypothetical protein
MYIIDGVILNLISAGRNFFGIKEKPKVHIFKDPDEVKIPSEGLNKELMVKTHPTLGNTTLKHINGAIHFMESDVTKALGYSNSRKAVSDHCRYVTKRDVPHPQSPNKTM